ncbi:MAG: FtsW/RodA/SpoVE family cell cycle protein [Clostridiales bacterium]|nr:FtsW/RodA/SpoVE family cell cycle protein [Clostridiales bacterium]
MQDRLYEIMSITLRYWYVFLIGCIFFLCLRDTASMGQDDRGKDEGILVFISILLLITGLGLLSFREVKTIDYDIVILAGLAAAVFLVQYFILKLLFRGLDGILLIIANTLFIIGLLLLQRLSPDLARNQVQWFALGSIALVISTVVALKISDTRWLLYPMMIAGVVLLSLAPLFGRVIGGAKNWISIEVSGREFGFQPSELVKLILIFVFAIEFSQKRGFKERLPVFIFTGLCMLILVFSRDLGGALHFFMVFIFIYPIATSDVYITLLAAGAGAVGSFISYRLFSHVKVRVEAWRNPWAQIEDRGYQIAHALIAIGSGGLFGSGLGLGIPYIIPASRTDLIFAAICEEMGILIGFMVIAFYAIITVRGAYIAMNSKYALDSLLAMGATASLAIQSFIIIGGVIKLIPLTGVTMPFASYGGSSMVVSFAMIGIIEGVAIKSYNIQGEELEEALEEDEG